MSHLMENSGIMSYENFCVKYFCCSRAKFESVIKAIPNSNICLIKETIFYSNSMSLCLPPLLIEGCKLREGRTQRYVILTASP